MTTTLDGRSPRVRALGLVMVATMLATASGIDPTAVRAGETTDRAAGEPAPARRQALIRMVRHDCGSCHGMELTGGLGPSLRPEALAGKPEEGLVATILAGRPGTPMPAWAGLLNEDETRWILQRLNDGFPPLR